jgi:hypothetical protein
MPSVAGLISSSIARPMRDALSCPAAANLEPLTPGGCSCRWRRPLLCACARVLPFYAALGDAVAPLCGGRTALKNEYSSDAGDENENGAGGIAFFTLGEPLKAMIQSLSICDYTFIYILNQL